MVKLCPVSMVTAYSQTCEAGYYTTSEGAAWCDACPAGQSCTDKTAAPADCHIGTFSLIADDFCRKCATGKMQLIFELLNLKKLFNFSVNDNSYSKLPFSLLISSHDI